MFVAIMIYYNIDLVCVDFNSNNDAIGKEIDFNEKQNKEFTNKTDTSTKHVQSSFKRSESKTNTTEPQPPDTEVASNDQNLQVFF